MIIMMMMVIMMMITYTITQYALEAIISGNCTQIHNKSSFLTFLHFYIENHAGNTKY